MYRALISSFVFALLVSCHSDAPAQKFRPFQKMKENQKAWKENWQKNWEENKPDGKLLKQIFGNEDSDEKQKPKSYDPSQQPTPAIRPTVTPSNPVSGKKPANNKSGKSHPSQLGIELSDTGDRIVISKLDSKGAGHLAGLKRGDEVLKVAGIELDGAEEFDAISRILNPGDQIEVEIKRKGKTETVIVQFGDAPESTEKIIDDDTPAAFTITDQDQPQAPIQFEAEATPDLSGRSSSRRASDSVLTDEFTKVAGKWVIDPPRNPHNVLPEPLPQGDAELNSQK